MLDRIVSLNGQSFEQGERLAEALRTAEGTVSVEYERSGKLASVSVEPLPPIDGLGRDLTPGWRASGESPAMPGSPQAPPATPGES